MSWNLEGMHIEAVYLDDYRVSGVVELSRVAYGGRVHHTIQLDQPLDLPWNSVARDRVIVEHATIQRVRDTA